MGKVYMFMQTKIFIKGNGKNAKLMDKANFITTKEWYTLDNGRMMRYMAEGNKFGQMVQFLQEYSKTEKNQMGSFHGPIRMFM